MSQENATSHMGGVSSQKYCADRYRKPPECTKENHLFSPKEKIASPIAHITIVYCPSA